ncbi:MAG: RNA methyltransferase substrate-binding domain-containing protein, partial [Anaerolineales bacterium]
MKKGEWIFGRQAVRETLRAGRRTAYLLRVGKGVREQGTLAEILGLARGKSLRIEKVEPQVLDRLGGNHQGVALQAEGYPLVPVGTILERCERAGSEALLLILDQI